MGDPVAWFGAVTGTAGLGVAVWTRVAQARYWKLEPIRERQRTLRREVLDSARTLLDEVQGSRDAARRHLELRLEIDAASKVTNYAVSSDETVRFASQEIPDLIMREFVDLERWNRTAFDYSSAETNFLAARENASRASHLAQPAEDLRRQEDDTRDTRNACARRLEGCADAAEQSLTRIIHALERMDYTP